jgi:DNA-binding transcriptional LysR family regulator
MKIHQLQALVTVADAGSIRASARLLGVSQAAVTKALRELEKDQQLTLLSRSPSGVSFTEAGQTLLGHARLMIGQLERANEDLAKLRGDQTGKLAIAITPLVMLTFMAETITLFRQQMPKVRLEIFEGLTAVAVPRMREGAADARRVAGLIGGAAVVGAAEPRVRSGTAVHVRVVRDRAARASARGLPLDSRSARP